MTKCWKKWDKLTRYLQDRFPYYDLQKFEEDWQREVIGLNRLHEECWGGGYLTFLVNYGDLPLHYARQALQNVKATEVLKIVDRCQQIVERYANMDRLGREKYAEIDTRTYFEKDGKNTRTVKGRMPQTQVDRVLEISEPLVDMITELNPKLLLYYEKFATASGIEL